MKKLIIPMAVSLFTVCVISCTSQNEPTFGDVIDAWLVPKNQVLDGGPGKDGIPSIDHPEFVSISEIDYLEETDLVLGIRVGNEVRGYPHAILNWHEIVNDEFQDQKFALTYCPLTGTGIGWDADLGNGKTSKFGVSGLLFDTNLMPYDRATNSTWSQQRLECVNGELIGRKSRNIVFLELTWEAWKESFPESKVMSDNTGFSRNYRSYPYGTYRTNNDFLIFPISNEDDRRPQKERVLGVVIDGIAKAYPIIGSDNGGGSAELIQDEFKGRDLLIYRDESKNLVTVFRNIDPTASYEIVQEALPIIFRDSAGNEWDLFGTAQSGPRKGEKMSQPIAFIGYWFSWGTFYPGLDIWE